MFAIVVGQRNNVAERSFFPAKIRVSLRRKRCRLTRFTRDDDSDDRDEHEAPKSSTPDSMQSGGAHAPPQGRQRQSKSNNKSVPFPDKQNVPK